MFKECKLEDMPPHIYAVANTAYRTMLRTRSAYLYISGIVLMGKVLFLS